MMSSAVLVVCICPALAAGTPAATAQERGLWDIAIPYAAAQPKITATVSLITGPAPQVTAEAIQLGGDSGLTIMQGVPLDEAEAWSRPVAGSLADPTRYTGSYLMPGKAPVIDQQFGASAAFQPLELSRALQESLLTKSRAHPDVKALTSALAEYPGMGGTGLYSASVGYLYRGAGVALKSESRELELDRKEVIELNWPDDRPRYYLEQQAENLFRRVELADKEGYAVALRAARVGGNLTVDLDLTRNTLAGGRYDETINAYVGKPTLIKTICQTSVPISAGTATVVTWNVPTGQFVDRAAAARVRYQAGVGVYEPARAPLAPAQPSGAVPGLAIVLSTQPLPAAGPPGPVPESPDAPADEPAAPAGGEVEEAEEVGAQVQVDLKFVEVPVGSAAWQKLAEGRAGGRTVEPEVLLEELAGDGDVRVIASPRLIALDNQKAELQIGQVEPYVLGLQEGEVDLGIHVAVTPRLLQAEGEVLLTLESQFDELLDKVQGANADPTAVVGTRQAKVLLRMPPGETAVLRGLVRMHQQTAEDGTTTKQPVETLILVTPRVMAGAKWEELQRGP